MASGRISSEVLCSFDMRASYISLRSFEHFSRLEILFVLCFGCLAESFRVPEAADGGGSVVFSDKDRDAASSLGSRLSHRSHT